MVNKYIDMHTHTNHSDALSTVENSLKKAEELGLSIISIISDWIDKINTIC